MMYCIKTVKNIYICQYLTETILKSQILRAWKYLQYINTYGIYINVNVFVILRHVIIFTLFTDVDESVCMYVTFIQLIHKKNNIMLK